ncbi:MAG: glycosyltransferase, partial [Acidimicrobiales bacterium]
MRVLAACSLGGAGHLRPLVPLLAAASRRGDDVLVIGPPALADMVAEAGFSFRPGAEPPEEAVASIRERLPVAPPAQASVLANRELFGRLATQAMLPAMVETVGEWAPDLILRDPCEYASAVAAGDAGVAVAQVAISFAVAEHGCIGVAGPALEPRRTGVTGEMVASPYLTRFPASLDPSPFATTIRFHEPPGPSGPLPDSVREWWDADGGPRVYLSFGTVLGHMSIATDVYRTALQAVARLDARVLLTVGRRFDRALLGSVPANVRVEAWVDQASVLERAEAVVCHGGSGTAFGSVAAGVPVVAVPVFADQFENGRRIAGVGAGLVIEHDRPEGDPRRVFGADDAPRITVAVERVLA